MLKPFLIRDLNPTAGEELEQPDRSPQDGHGSPEPTLDSPFDDEPVMAYKPPDIGEDGKFCPHLTYDRRSILSMETDGRIAEGDGDRVIPSSKRRPDHSDRSSDARSIKMTDALVTPTPKTDRHGIVQVSAEEYDETIAAHPQASLSYMDEDDGDTITIGSSLELAERLEEPASSAVFYPSSISVTDRQHEGPMHIFDVNRSQPVLDIWRSFEQRTSTRCRQLDSSVSTHPDASAPEVAANASNAHLDPLFEIRSDDPQDGWLRLRNPPPIPLSTLHQSESVSIGEVSSLGGDQPSELGTSARSEPAQEASPGLCHAKSISSDTYISIPVPPLPSMNPWASLGTGPSGFVSNGLTQREPESRESPIEENEPLLASFEAELSKIMEDKLIVDSSTTVSEEKNPVETTSLQPPTSQLESEPSSPPVPKPAEMLAQTMQTLLGGVRHLTSELRSKLPEVERRLSSAHQHIPSTVETTLFNTISAIGSHVQSLANAIQATATSSRAAADRSREVDLLATDQIVNGLRTLAGDIRDMGRTLFAAFDTPPRPAGTSEEHSNGEHGEHFPANGDIHDHHTPELSTSQPSVSLNNSTNLLPCPGAPENDRQIAVQQQPVWPDSNRNTTLFIGNLHDAVTEQEIAAAFANKGFLGKVNLPNDSATGNHAGFGYVEFPCSLAASGALQALNGDLIHGRIINLEFSHVVDTATDSTAQQPPSQAVQPSPHSPAEGIKPWRRARPPPPRTMSQRASVYGRMQTASLNDVSNPNASTSSTGIRRAKSLGILRRPLANDASGHNIPTMNNISERPEGQGKPNVEADNLPYHHHHPSPHAKRTRLTSLYSAAASSNNTPTDQADVEPGFSARYPSLVPETYNHANRRAHSPSPQGQDVPRTFSPESQMARFPTVSQLEARHHTTQQLHPGGQWTPGRPPMAIDGNPSNETSASDAPASNLRDLHPILPPPVEGRAIPGSWPPEFYNTRSIEPHTSSPTPLSELRRSNTTIASDPAARLSGPFVPFTERHQRSGHSNLRRNATERQHSRPVGRYFGRHHHAPEERTPIYNSYIRPGFSTDPLASIPGSFPAEAPPVVLPKPIRRSSERQPEMQEHHRLTADNSLRHDIDKCIAHLGLLGYGYDSSLPSHNLHIYAEASNGILEDAIEMIEEERKAYKLHAVPQ
ncbi:hypothetical protein AJ78_03174 [Emergomyces pasteurianus Ep9510]|uniref:RRM domain-containing protein n=1 Tax=Emergomyces pasteurianus Ep9510 TaxID=1447872 RepID=A0A1J9PJJ9_9EURO|nr:hypothetical protein AJ78_03174 [Emergomyces pasteurianus Ep9510]